MTFRSFLRGQPQFIASSPWPLWLAIPVAVLCLIGAQMFAALLLAPLAGIDAATLPGLRPGSHSPSALDGATHRALMLLVLLSQVAVAVLMLATALWGGAQRVLSLGSPSEGWGMIGWALVGMVPLVIAYNLAAVLIAPELAARDFGFFRDIARGAPPMLTALAIGIGAPLSEELLFRGFLLAALARWTLGFWPAAVLATLGWTLLHFGYSWVGLAEVFLFGLYFSWLLWRTGSLWPPLVCHGVYNSALLIVLRYWPVA